MADSTTTNYALVLPEEFASTNTWGGKINTNLAAIDSTMKAISDVANAAVPNSRTVAGDGTTISGGGALTGNVTLAQIASSTIQRVKAFENGTLKGASAPGFNFIPGAFIAVGVVYNAAEDRYDVTITGADSDTEITESLSVIGKASSIDRTGFDGAFVTTTPAVFGTVPSGRICPRPLVVVTNNSSSDEGVACWFVPSGGSASDANKVKSSGYLRVPAGQFIVIGEDRLINLEAGATIVLQSESTTTALSCRVSMETVPDSNTAFIVGTPTLLGTSLATIRTVGAKTSRVSWIAHNVSANIVGLTVAYRPDDALSDSAAYNVGLYGGVHQLEPGGVFVYDFPDVLNAGDLIRAGASHASSVSFRLSTVEIA